MLVNSEVKDLMDQWDRRESLDPEDLRDPRETLVLLAQ